MRFVTCKRKGDGSSEVDPSPEGEYVQLGYADLPRHVFPSTGDFCYFYHLPTGRIYNAERFFPESTYWLAQEDRATVTCVIKSFLREKFDTLTEGRDGPPDPEPVKIQW